VRNSKVKILNTINNNELLNPRHRRNSCKKENHRKDRQESLPALSSKKYNATMNLEEVSKLKLGEKSNPFESPEK
jgi:replication initiation and membrane attachment protein DnaB